LRGLAFTEEDAKIYDQEDENGHYLTRSLRRTGGEDRREDRPSMYYGIKGPDGVDVFPIGPGGYESRWICGQKKYEDLKSDGLIEWKQLRDGRWWPYQKFYLEGRRKLASNLWDDIEGNKKASRDMKALFGEKIFDSPKPVGLIQKCVGIGAEEEAIILDFFAGSGTTAHAVLDLNKEDGGDRKFILVQLPEPCDPDSAAANAGFVTIADICEERVRRVIKKLNDEDAGKLPLDGEEKQDRGFRVFKLAESNFLAWNADIPRNDVATLEKQLEMHVDHVRDGRTAEDRLYELLLKSGFPLTTPVETLTIEDKAVYSVAEGEMLICLDGGLTLETIRAMAARKPSRVVCLDEGFSGNDQLKTNAVQTFKDKNVHFQTV
jgi:adenine-specific DNA-methyltransferase